MHGTAGQLCAALTRSAGLIANTHVPPSPITTKMLKNPTRPKTPSVIDFPRLLTALLDLDMSDPLVDPDARAAPGPRLRCVHRGLIVSDLPPLGNHAI